jgi:hypothetical protein
VVACLEFLKRCRLVLNMDRPELIVPNPQKSYVTFGAIINQMGHLIMCYHCKKLLMRSQCLQ